MWPVIQPSIWPFTPLSAAFGPAVWHSWASVGQQCASLPSIYVLLFPNYEAAWQEKPQWPRHRCAAKALHNTQLQTAASDTSEFVIMCCVSDAFIHLYLFWFSGTCFAFICDSNRCDSNLLDFVARFPFLSVDSTMYSLSLSALFTSSCYVREWAARVGATIGYRWGLCYTHPVCRQVCLALPLCRYLPR